MTQWHLYATIPVNKEREVDKMIFHMLIKSSTILSAEEVPFSYGYNGRL